MSDESPENKPDPEPSAGAQGDAPPPSETESEGGDAVLDALWNKALESWNDDKVHRALLEHALRNEGLPVLAGRYRALKDDQEMGAIAKKRIDAIVIAATQIMMSMKTPKPTGNPLWLTASAVFVTLLVLGWVAYAVLKR